MIASRRLSHNFALDRALEHCRSQGGKSLVILEALRCDYPWAGDRLHRFVLDGLQKNLPTPLSGSPAADPLLRAGLPVAPLPLGKSPPAGLRPRPCS
jgi:deoxyribodipyrimidine photo-lyase